MKRSAVLPFFLLLATSYALASEPGRFSGTWKENREKSTKSSLTSYVNTIDATADVVKVKTTTNSPRGERTSERTYAIGKEVTSKLPDGDEATTSARWEDNALVIVSTVHEPDGTAETKETWTVSADGKTLTKKRHIHNANGDRDETHVLERQ